MRIIGGFLKGRRFDPPADKWPTRPTTDISKEGLYNMLQSRTDIHGARFLDLFGGTGNHCYEMISRGAHTATYVDQFGPAFVFAQTTAKTFGIDTQIKFWKVDVRKFLKKSTEQFDIVFAGPPYGLDWLDHIPDLIFDSNVLASGALFILEHNPNHNFDQHPRFLEMRSYGQTHFSFFE